MYGRNSCNSITSGRQAQEVQLRDWQLTTGIKLLYCLPLWLADWCHKSLTEYRSSWVQAFCHDIFSAAAVAYSRVTLWVFWCGHCNYLYLAKPSDTNVSGRICSSSYLERPSPAWQFASVRSGERRLLASISQSSTLTTLKDYVTDFETPWAYATVRVKIVSATVPDTSVHYA